MKMFSSLITTKKFTLAFVLLSSCLISQTTARAVVLLSPEIKEPDSDYLSTSIDFNAPLEIDTSEPPTLGQGEWILLSPEQAELKHVRRGSEEGGLRKRATEEKDEITSVAASGSAVTTVHIALSTVTEKASTTTTSTSRAEETAPVSSSLPKFFDGSLSANFAPNSNCPSFLNSFLNNQTFNQCYPISLLMQVRLFSFSLPPFLLLSYSLLILPSH